MSSEIPKNPELLLSTKDMEIYGLLKEANPSGIFVGRHHNIDAGIRRKLSIRPIDISDSLRILITAHYVEILNPSDRNKSPIYKLLK